MLRYDRAMAHARRLPVDIRKLQSQGDEGVLILRLMMACNDLTTANQALGMSYKDTREKTDYIRRGSTMYFVRLQLSHLHEALEVVSEIRDHPKLLRVIEDCPKWRGGQLCAIVNVCKGWP